MDVCQEARNAIAIVEVPCPNCGGSMEFFIKDGFLAVDALCDSCSFAIPAGSRPSKSA